jgi:hypothetical protein
VGRKPVAKPRPEDHEPWVRLFQLVSLQREAKPEAAKGWSRKHGGRGVKVSALTGEIWWYAKLIGSPSARQIML